MSDDIDDITPPHGTPIVVTTATVREGRHTPEHDAPALPGPGDDLWSNLESARDLAREVRHRFFGDARYPRLRPGLAMLRARLQNHLRAKLEDDELLDLYDEVVNLLPRNV